MTDYVITNGRSSAYPARHYGAQFTGNRATFCLESDLSGLDSNTLAIPDLPVTVLTASPISVAAEFYGMHIESRSNDSASGVTFKTVRSHDMENGKGRWQFIQPTSTTWDWGDLDSWVNAHYAAGRDMIFTLFATPSWASARATERNAYSDQDPEVIQYNRGIAAEPSDMSKWDAYCTAVATRYLGKIKYYEVWNEPNYQNDGTGATGTYCYFSGTFAKLSEMARRANQAIKAVDPTAKIICPPVTAWASTAGGDAETYFTGMLGTSSGDAGTTPMKNWIDIVGVHLYVSGNSAKSLSGIVDRVSAAKTTAGVSGMETWDTESAPLSPYVTSVADYKALPLMARSLIVTAAKGVSRTVYYRMDDESMGFYGMGNVISYREHICGLLRSGAILCASVFSDGRVAYNTSAGVTII